MINTLLRSIYMAKIVEDIVIIKFSKIVKDSESDSQALVSDDIRKTLEEVAEELAGKTVVVEVISQ